MCKPLTFLVVFIFILSNSVFSHGSIVGPNISASGGPEGSIAINPIDSENLIGTSNTRGFYSLDGGKTWADSSPLNGTLNIFSDTNVAFDSQGNAFRQGLSILGGGIRGIAVWKSTDEGQNYPDSLMTMAFDDPNGNADQGFMAIDTQTNNPYKDNIYLVWSDYGTGPTLDNTLVGFPLLFTSSTDGGTTFSTPIDISSSSSQVQEHSSHINISPNGEIYVVWIKEGTKEVMFNRSLDGGATWDTDIVVRSLPTCSISTLLSDDVRGNPTVAVDRSDGAFKGYIYVSGMDNNTCTTGGTDAWIVSSTNGGDTFSNAYFLSDGPQGNYKYYFQPRIEVAAGGRVDATWYDTRFNTSTDTNNVTYDLFFSYSVDGGLTFEPNIRVTEISSVKVTNCGSQGICGHRVIFEYMGLASDNTRAFPLWMDLRNGLTRQFTASLNFGDTDNDGMPDWWEIQYGLDPFDSTDAGLDGDEDSLNNLQEFQQGTDPTTLNTHTLTLITTGTGTGSVSGAGVYNLGDTANVSATPDPGSTFDGWSGTNGPECATGSVLMNADKSCTATFTLLSPAEFVLSISSLSGSGGTMNSSSHGLVPGVSGQSVTGSGDDGSSYKLEAGFAAQVAEE